MSFSPEPTQDLSSNLSSSSFDLSAADQKFLDQWSSVIPQEKYRNLAIAWLRALDAVGTPATFLDGLQFKTQGFRMLGEEYPGFTRQGGNHELRRELMAVQEKNPYEPRVALESLPHRVTKLCLLCQNILQSADSKIAPDAVRQNAIFDLGDYIVTPNKYPGFPLHMLWLPKNHDDLFVRVDKVLVREEGREVVTLPGTPGKTRGALLNTKDILAMIQLCDEWDLVAVRNHPLSAMSIPDHDHWHLFPKSCFPVNWCEDIAGVDPSEGAELRRATGTPFDILVVKKQGEEQFAARIAEILNSLEHDNQVFSPSYIPGREGFALVSALRHGEMLDRSVPIGGKLQHHEVAPTDVRVLKLFDTHAPRRFEYDWNRYTFDPNLSRKMEYTAEEIRAIHKPIDYVKMSQWGGGSLVLDRISPLCQRMYQQTLALQDKRDDPGHIDTVIHFTLLLAEYLRLPEVEKEAGVLAAIFHDVGWASVENINTRWNELVTRYWSEDLEAKAKAKAEMDQLRLLHQDVSADAARKLIGAHPYLEEICAVVNDHDTRQERHPDFFRAFLDGDWMWRVTRTSRYAQSSGQYDRTDYAVVRSKLEKEIKPNDFTLPWAYEIARIELENTISHMAKEYGWGI